MSQTLLLLVAATLNGPGEAICVPAERANRSFVINLSGTGPLSATITYEVSNDNGLTWASRVTFNLNGTGLVTDTDVDANSPFTCVRGRVSNLTGTNASVSMTGCAA